MVDKRNLNFMGLRVLLSLELSHVISFLSSITRSKSYQTITVDWTELPLDIIISIAEKLEFFEDLIHFHGVCKTWRQSKTLAKANSALSPKTPWLMILESRDKDKTYIKNIRFYPVHKTQTIHEVLNLPKLPNYIDTMGGTHCLSTRGCLVYISKNYEAISLIHPMSLEIIECPSLPQGLIHVFQNRGEKYCVYNAVRFSLSDNPAKTSEYTLAMISTGCNRIGVWCSRETEWVVREFSIHEIIMDVNFYKGELYHVNLHGLVRHSASGKRMTSLSPWFLERGDWIGFVHLMEVNSALVIVRQEMEYFGEEESDGRRNLKIKCFKAWSLDVENAMLMKLSSLGNYALFLGYNNSFSVEACSSYGIKANCVYHVGKYPGTINMGVYELWSNKKIEDHYDSYDSRLHRVPLWLY